MTGFSTVSSSPYNIVTALYRVTTAFAGVAVGDILQSVEVYDQIANPAAPIDTVWNNLTQQTALGAITPLAANITPIANSTSTGGDVSTTQVYTVTTAFGISDVGDVVENLVVYDPTAVPPTQISSSWYNLTKLVSEPTDPTASDVTPGTSQSVSADVVTTALYAAVATSAGQYTIGDIIQQVNTLNPVTQAIVKSQYNNLTTGSYDITIAAQTDIVPGSPTSTQYATIFDSYTVINAVTGGAPGEVLQRVQTLDTSTTPSTVTSTVWNNISTGATGITAPALTDLTPGFNQSYLNNVQIFTANTNSTTPGQYSTGDIIEQVVAFDPSINPPLIVSTSYNNLSTAVNNITLDAYSDITFGTTAADTFNAVVSVQYVALNSVSTGVTAGDILQQTLVYDISVNPPTLFSTAWFNLTTDLEVTGASIPAPTDVAPYFGGFLTDAQLRAAPVVVSTAQLPTVLGQTIMADSTSVTIASDQSAIPVTTTQLAATLGQQTMAASAGVVIASDQSAIPVTAVQLPAVLGQTVAANSLAVTLASDAVVSVTDTTTFNYTVTTAFTGAALGDIVSRYTILDSSTVPPTTISETWYNVTQGTTLASAPSYADIAIGGGNVTPVLPARNVVNYTSANSSGNTPAGCTQVSFANTGTGDAIVAGQTITPGSGISYDAPAGGTINSISYDSTGTVLLIATLQ